MSITYLRGALEPGVSVSLIPTACYSGGWAVSLDFNTEVVVDKDAKGSSMPNTRPSYESIGHACGSVFASTLVKALSCPTGLLSVEENGEENSEEDEDDDDDEENMACNFFCKALWDTCKDRVYRLWEHQESTFRPDDQWVYSRAGRTGIPLAHFEQRWNQLLPHPCLAPADVRLQRNPAPTSVDRADQEYL